MNYKELTGKSIREGFNEFNRENPHVYKAFEEQALRAINRGKTKLSAKHIINWIRWEVSMQTTDENFKVNDAFQAYYAREFIKNFPQYESYFSLRKLRNEESGQYMLQEDGQYAFL